jgi:hypothetical protein
MPAGKKKAGKGKSVKRKPGKPAKRRASKHRKTRATARKKAKPGTDFERGIEDFAEEMEWHGKRLEGHGKRLEKRAKSWWYTTFGPVGPLIKSLVDIAIIGIAAFFISIVNVVLVSAFVSGLALFIMDYIPVFFVVFIFFNYIKYFYYTSPNTRLVLRPLEAAAGVTVMFWVLGWVMLLAHQSAEIGVFQMAANWIFPNLWNLFFVVLALTYLGAIMVYSQRRIAVKGGK